jgi:hypothetical protein
MILKKQISLLAGMLFLASCAIMDISSQETAIPLEPKNVSVSLYEGMGIELTTLMDEEQDDGSGFLGWFVTGLKAGISLSPKVDLVGRVYTAGSSTGGKLGVKTLIRQEDTAYTAILPEFTWVNWYDYSDKGDESSRALGLEASLMQSWKLDKALIPTVGARLSYEYISEGSDGTGVRYHHHIVHAGVFTSLKLVLGPVHLQPEVGLEILPPNVTGRTVFPNASLGLGLEL